MWLLLCPFFFSTPFTLRVVWVRTLSGRTLAGLSVEQLEVQELTATPSPGLCLNWKQRSQPCGQVDNGSSEPGPLRVAETGHCQPKASSHSHSLRSSIFILPLGSEDPESAPSVCPASLEREGKPSIHAPKVCLPWSAPLYLMAHPWSILAWVSLMVIC